MNFLKKWAKKILKDELNDLKDELNELKGDLKHYKEQAAELQDRCDNLNEAKLEAMKTIRERNEKLKELKQENVILKKYYHLYDEPTEEQEIEIRAKLKVRDLQKEIDQYKLMLQQSRIYFPVCTTLYSGGIPYAHF